MGYAGMVRSNYAAGDYYGQRGGNYGAGDPGILGSLFKGVTGAIGGLITGGPVGAIAGGIGGLLSSGKPAPSPQIAPPAMIPFSGGPVQLQVPQPTSRTTIGPFGSLYSSTQYAPGGSTEAQKRALIASIGGRKRRRMNVTNPKALRRALRRVTGFGKLVQRSRKAIGRAASAAGVHRRSYRGGSRGVITRSEAARALRS